MNAIDLEQKVYTLLRAWLDDKIMSCSGLSTSDSVSSEWEDLLDSLLIRRIVRNLPERPAKEGFIKMVDPCVFGRDLEISLDTATKLVTLGMPG